jgi:periplasmic protein TonB
MRWAIPVSASIHLGLIASALLFLQSPPADLSSAEEAVSIAIVAVEEAVAEPTETVSEESANLVSSGTTQADAEPVEAETVDPVEEAVVESVQAARPVQPVAVAAVTPVAEPVAPVEIEELVSAEVMAAAAIVATPVVAPIPQVTSDAAPIVAETVAPNETRILEHLDETARLATLLPKPEVQQITTGSIMPVTPVEPVKVANLSPVLEEIVEETAEAPPVPAPRLVRKPVDVKEPVEAKKPAENKPSKKKPVEKKTKQVASLGNGGENDADSAAAKAGGKQGKVSSDGGDSAAYAGKVRAKVIKALKRPSGSYDAGEARVTFTIDPSGRLDRVRISGSSGDAKVDKAVVAAVERAAPFPGFSEGGPRSFTIPLMIQ